MFLAQLYVLKLFLRGSSLLYTTDFRLIPLRASACKNRESQVK